MAWLPRVTDAQRAEFKAWGSTYYGRRFEVLDITDEGTTSRAAARNDTYPILLIEPASGERLSPDAAFQRPHPSWQSWSVLTGGLLLTALMGALLLVISGERTPIQAQVDDAPARLREREARLQAILDNAADAIITVARDGDVLSANAAAGALFAYPPEQLCGLRVERLLEVPDGDAAGARFPLPISASQVTLRREDICVCIIDDLTEQRRAQEHIYQLAHHDTLTGLENRFALSQHLDQLLAHARAPVIRWRCCSSTSATSSRSTTRTATRPATCCWSKWRSGCASCCATSTSSPVSAATNSSSWWPAR